MDCLKKGHKELKNKPFLPTEKEEAFVVKTSFDIEDGSLVHQVYIGKVEEIKDEDISESIDSYQNEEDQDEHEHEDPDNEDFSENETQNDEIDITNFVCFREKRTRQKEVVLVILKKLSHGNDLFTMFDLEEKIIK